MTENSEDLVYLLIGEHDEADGEVMPRLNMPTDAYQATFAVKLSGVADGEVQGADRDLEVWVVAR